MHIVCTPRKISPSDSTTYLSNEGSPGFPTIPQELERPLLRTARRRRRRRNACHGTEERPSRGWDVAGCFKILRVVMSVSMRKEDAIIQSPKVWHF